ncbi:MAG: prepilin-type N-terminal cleavage/methylation domain-containing protein [Planctomycetes bacterium]|nr:prepilin-type N-terminal cleavage/methylation domain-containing protein [Planctomycetota bacterium]
MNRIRAGFSLLEVVIVVAILAVIVGAFYATLASGDRHYNREVTQREAAWKLREALDLVVADIRESSTGLTRVQTAADPLFSTPTTLVAAPSARDEVGVFHTEGNRPVWQTLIVYALHLDSSDRTPELRRYVVSGNSASFKRFFEPGATPLPSISVTATELRFEDVAVPRSSGAVVLENAGVFSFSKPTEAGAVGWDVELRMAGLSAVPRGVGIESAVHGRN